jgi:hypothetical protein
VVPCGRENDRPDRGTAEGGLVTDRAEDSAGDYGYDMAHEQGGREKAPGERSGERSGEHVGPSPARRKVEAEQDMSYDEAHDF